MTIDSTADMVRCTIKKIFSEDRQLLIRIMKQVGYREGGELETALTEILNDSNHPKKIAEEAKNFMQVFPAQKSIRQFEKAAEKVGLTVEVDEEDHIQVPKDSWHRFLTARQIISAQSYFTGGSRQAKSQKMEKLRVALVTIFFR